METLHGKVSAPSAGERGHAQVDPQDKTQGNMAQNWSLWGPKRLRHISTLGLEENVCIWVQIKCLYVAAICRTTGDGSPVTFTKFEEKKNAEKGRRINTVRRLFWGTPSPPQKGPGKALLRDQMHRFRNHFTLPSSCCFAGFTKSALLACVVVCICHKHVLIMNHFCLNYVFYCL